MSKTRIIVIVAITLILSVLTIINIPKDKQEEPIQDTTTTIKVETTNTTTTTTKVVRTTKKHTKKVTMKVNANQQEILDYLLQEVLNMGWSKKDYESAVNIIIKESSINPNSVNKSSGACGLFQAYPCSKAIKKYPDYMTNYKSQVNWGLNYIKGRYKTPTKAWEFWQENKWY